jgi:predicted nuclease with TOPRIM domain
LGAIDNGEHISVNRPSSLTAKLKAADVELRNYLIELEKENLKLHKQLAKLQVKNVSMQNEIKALKENQTGVVINLSSRRLD